MVNPVPDAFVDDLAFELRRGGVPVLRSELRRWLADCGPMVAEDPAISRWAAAFLEAHPSATYRAVSDRLLVGSW